MQVRGQLGRTPIRETSAVSLLNSASSWWRKYGKCGRLKKARQCHMSFCCCHFFLFHFFSLLSFLFQEYTHFAWCRSTSSVSKHHHAVHSLIYISTPHCVDREWACHISFSVIFLFLSLIYISTPHCVCVRARARACFCAYLCSLLMWLACLRPSAAPEGLGLSTV